LTVKYATQILAILLIVSLVSVMAISTILYVNQINSQKEQLSTVLKSISQIGADNISRWIDERKINVQNIAEAKVFTTAVRDLTDTESTSQEIFQSKLEIQSLATYVDNSWVWVEGLKISDPNTGEKIFGYKNSPTKNLIDQQHFIDAVNGNVATSEIYSSEELVINEFGKYEKNVPTLLISTPIYGETGLEGVLTVRINIFKIDSGVIQYVSDFNSGDAYMVNSEGFLLSRSAFPQDILDLVDRRPELELRVFDPINQELTKLFQSADKSQSITIIEGYNDYRGIPVIGSINPILGTEWFYIFEIDEAEAYKDFQIMEMIVGYSLAMLALMVFVTSSYFAQMFSKPIIYLKESAEQIAGGNLDTPIKTKGAYEVLKLSESMEEMRKSVKKSIETEKELATAQQKIDLNEKLEKEKEDFIAMITHDLKQPLVPISGNAEMLGMPQMGELNEMQKECVAEIAVNVNRQVAMIDNLVSAQKLGAGAMKFEVEELSTKDILKECIKTHSPAMIDKKLEYFDSSTIDVKVKGDNRRIQESYTNLILNAHDFVPEKGKIEIGVTDGDKEVTFFCKDNGEGIPKDKQDKLFKKYGQVKSNAKRKFGGTGLGLTVSQQLIEGMGGKIWLESEVGEGSTFFFTIPKSDGEQK